MPNLAGPTVNVAVIRDGIASPTQISGRSKVISLPCLQRINDALPFWVYSVE